MLASECVVNDRSFPLANLYPFAWQDRLSLRYEADCDALILLYFVPVRGALWHNYAPFDTLLCRQAYSSHFREEMAILQAKDGY